MAKAEINGTCRICGNNVTLSKEHFPPQKANNNQTFFKYPLEEVLDGVKSKGIQLQGGVSDFTLCGTCNNNTGGWYGSEYTNFCKSLTALLKGIGDESEVEVTLDIRPLRLLKQIVSSFFSVQDDQFHANHQELQQFVLDKDYKNLNAKYRFFIYLCIETETHNYRRNPIVSHMDLQTGERIIISEISHPPLGVVMTIDSAPKDTRLFEITNFSSYDYNEVVSFPHRIPLLSVNTMFSGNYE